MGVAVDLRSVLWTHEYSRLDWLMHWGVVRDSHSLARTPLRPPLHGIDTLLYSLSLRKFSPHFSVPLYDVCGEANKLNTIFYVLINVP